MKRLCVQLTDLSDEILLLLLKNLTNVEVLYSLRDVNKRLDKMVHDSIFTSNLALFNSFSNGDIYPIPPLILDRFCSQILPKIHQKIKWPDLEPLSMERILLSANYPNLFGLGIYNIDKDTALNLFTGKIFSFV